MLRCLVLRTSCHCWTVISANHPLTQKRLQFQARDKSYEYHSRCGQCARKRHTGHGIAPMDFPFVFPTDATKGEWGVSSFRSTRCSVSAVYHLAAFNGTSEPPHKTFQLTPFFFPLDWSKRRLNFAMWSSLASLDLKRDVTGHLEIYGSSLLNLCISLVLERIKSLLGVLQKLSVMCVRLWFWEVLLRKMATIYRTNGSI